MSVPARTAPPAAGRPAPRQAPRPRSGPRLEVVEGSARPGHRVPVAVFCAVVMLATLMAVLMLNIALSRGSYESHELTQRRTALVEQEQALREELAAAAAPGALADRARALGMVPGGEPGVVRLSDGTLSGEPAPATAPPPAEGAAPADQPAEQPTDPPADQPADPPADQ